MWSWALREGWKKKTESGHHRHRFPSAAFDTFSYIPCISSMTFSVRGTKPERYTSLKMSVALMHWRGSWLLFTIHAWRIFFLSIVSTILRMLVPFGNTKSSMNFVPRTRRIYISMDSSSAEVLAQTIAQSANTSAKIFKCCRNGVERKKCIVSAKKDNA